MLVSANGVSTLHLELDSLEVIVYLAACEYVLSCCKMKVASLSPKHFFVDGRRFSFKIAQYFVEFIVPSTTVNFQTPASLVYPHTITDRPFMKTSQSSLVENDRGSSFSDDCLQTLDLLLSFLLNK